MVYVTGRSQRRTSSYDYATVDYNAATGAQRWVSRYNGPVNGNEFANAVIVSPGGQTIYVTGGSAGKAPRTYFAPLAHNAGTRGAPWVRRDNRSGPFRGSRRSPAAAPHGRPVIVPR